MVTGTGLSVMGISTLDDFAEGFTEVIRKKGVQDRVNAGVHVGQDMTDDLNHNAAVCNLVSVYTLQYQDQLYREPADSEDGDHDDDHTGDPLLAPPALCRHVASRRRPAPQPQ